MTDYTLSVWNSHWLSYFYSVHIIKLKLFKINFNIIPYLILCLSPISCCQAHVCSVAHPSHFSWFVLPNNISLKYEYKLLHSSLCSFPRFLLFFSYVRIFLSALCETRSVWRYTRQEMSTMYFTMPYCAHIVLAVRFLKCEIIIITPVTFHWDIFCKTLFQILCSYSSIFYSSWVPQTCYLSTDGLHKKITVPWNVTPCRLKEKCWRFERIPCLYISRWRWIEKVPSKHQFLSAKMRCMTFHNTTV